MPTEEWIRLCSVAEAPEDGEVAEVETEGRQVCLARIAGSLHAIDNLCPHRQGPLGQGWIEGNAVLCPWHAWAFDVNTGLAHEPECAQVAVFPLRTEGNDLFVKLV